MLCDPFTGIGIAYLEANSRRWDDLPGFRVFFDDLNEGLKGGVVDETPFLMRRLYTKWPINDCRWIGDGPISFKAAICSAEP